MKWVPPWFHCTLIVALLPLAVFAKAEPPDIPHAEYLIKNWSTVDGLPDTTVRAITQDRDGYLWVGTGGGIARFDGIRFRSFTTGNTPALVSDNVFDLAEDQAGRLWFATSHGLAVRENGEFRWYDEPDGPGRKTAYGIGTDGSGRLWVQTPKGFLRHDGTRFQTISADPFAAQFVIDPSGQLWAGGPKGVERWNGTSFDPVPDTASVDSMTVDGTGRIWMLRFPNELSVLEAGKVRSLPSPAPVGSRPSPPSPVVTSGWVPASGLNPSAIGPMPSIVSTERTASTEHDPSASSRIVAEASGSVRTAAACSACANPG
jgi:ligand-binding sensor domain-containing protein